MLCRLCCSVLRPSFSMSHSIADSLHFYRAFASTSFYSCHERLLKRSQPIDLIGHHLLHPQTRVYCSDDASKRKGRLKRWHIGMKQTTSDMREQIRKEKSELKRQLYTVPNMLCLVRIGLSPILGILVLKEVYSVALLIFCVAGVTDLVSHLFLLLDGQIARRYPSQQSALGSALDPMADKFLVSILFLSLTAVGLIPVPLTVLVIGRDIFLLSGGAIVRYQTMDSPKTLRNYFDVSRLSLRVKPLFISKVNTAFQLMLVAVSLCSPVFGFADHSVLQICWYATGITTLGSAVSYAVSYRTAIEKVPPSPK